MRIPKILYPAGILILSIGLWALWSTSRTDSTKTPNNKPQPDKPCGLETCHGLDVSCGPDIAEMCTEMYMAGDGCLQFVHCGYVNGQCTQIDTARFEQCAACVQRCEQLNPDDPTQFFQCENACVN